MLNGPTAVRIGFYLTRPASASRSRLSPFVRPDLDKIVRALFDARTIAGVIELEPARGLCYGRKMYEARRAGGEGVASHRATVGAASDTGCVASERTVYQGKWWLPGEDRDVDGQYGALTVDPDERLTLELVGGFPIAVDSPPDAAGRAIVRTVDNFPVVYGESEGRGFTLLSVMPAQTHGSIQRRPDRQTLSPQRALAGDVYIESADRPAINGALIEVDYLLFFSQLNAHTHEDSIDGDAIESTAFLTRQKTLTARWKDISFTAGLAWSSFATHQDNPNTQTLGSTQRAQLLIDFDEPKSLSEVDTVISRMQDLLTVAMNRPCASRATTYRIKRLPSNNDRERERAEVDPMYHLKGYGRHVYTTDAEPFRDPRHGNVLLTVAQIPFADIVPRWLDLYERATVGLQMFAGTRYMNAGYASTRLNTICVTAEAIHTSLYDHPKMDPAEFDTLLGQAIAGVASEAHRDILGRVLRNGLSYRDRTRELVDRLPVDVVETVIGKPNLWIRLITNSRNDLAHANDNGHDGSTQVFLLMITQLILAMVIGLELGLTQQAIRAFAESQWSLTTRWKEVTGQTA